MNRNKQKTEYKYLSSGDSIGDCLPYDLVTDSPFGPNIIWPEKQRKTDNKKIRKWR